MNTTRSDQAPICVVGGGLAGLAAASYAARSGRPVQLFDALSQLGGRARTRDENGFRFNMGPHALYTEGRGGEVLAELGVDPPGARPPLSGALGVLGGKLHTLPLGVATLLSTGLIGAGAKLELARMLAGLTKADYSHLSHTPLREALRELLRHEENRRLIEANVRLSTYVNAPDRISAGMALGQLQLAAAAVRYVHGGWQTLVDALAEVALGRGVKLRAGERVSEIVPAAAGSGADASAAQGPTLRLADGETIEAAQVVLALGPREASALVPGHEGLARSAAGLTPVRAACLDLGLTRLPKPKRGFALGVDEPTYVSVHSLTAELAPPGGGLVHAARYLEPDEVADRDTLLRSLETAVDRLQPGWRERVAERVFLREVTVTWALPTADGGGLAGRPGPALPDLPGVWLAGDWVGSVGHLADASLASGRAAGCAAAEACASRSAA